MITLVESRFLSRVEHIDTEWSKLERLIREKSISHWKLRGQINAHFAKLWWRPWRKSRHQDYVRGWKIWPKAINSRVAKKLKASQILSSVDLSCISINWALNSPLLTLIILA